VRVIDNFIVELWISNLRYADDPNLLEVSRDTLRRNLWTLKRDEEQSELKINPEKTKSVSLGEQTIDRKLMTENEEIQNVNEFVYLERLLTWDNDGNKELAVRIEKAAEVMAGLETLWKTVARICQQLILV
jgi:hypothetical protein